MKDGVKMIFENDNFLVVDKPSGLVVHGDGRTQENTLVDWLKNFCTENNIDIEKQKNIGRPHTLDSGRYVDRWGIVNRLDRDTSGLILIAKNEATFNELQKLFQEHKITKIYKALLWGIIDFDEKTVTEKIVRHKKDPRIWTCGFTREEGAREGGLDAETFVQVLERDSDMGLTLVKIIPKTGRTHQLRLHCRFLGHPIVGDRKYGIEGIINEHSTRQVENLITEANLTSDRGSRLCLHAESLQFELGGEEFFFESGVNF